MSGNREATSEQSSWVHEGAGYDKVYPLGHRPKKGLSWSLEREPSAHSPDDEKESYDGEKEWEGGEDEESKDCEGEDDEDEGESDKRAYVGGSSGSPGDGHTRHFILPMIWTVNDFKPMMTTKIFNNLRDHYQILDNIPIHLPGKFEKWYSRKTVDVGMYNAMFAAGLRLPLMALHR